MLDTTLLLQHPKSRADIAPSLESSSLGSEQSVLTLQRCFASLEPRLILAVAVPEFPNDLPVAPIPRIYLSALLAGDETESLRLFDACCDHGFFLLDLNEDETGLEIVNDIETGFRLGKEFFASDLTEKEAFKLSPGNVGYVKITCYNDEKSAKRSRLIYSSSYKPMGMIKHTNGQSDLTEICAVGRDSILDPQSSSIPQVYQRERPTLQTIVNRLHLIASYILKSLSKHLEIPFPAIEAMHRFESPSSSVLRFLHNPPQKPTSSTAGRQQSLLGHTDNGTLTILFTQIGGLQVLPIGADENTESAWLWVRPEPKCAIINVGDSLVQWTGGVLSSALHRVLYAPGVQAEEERYSWGYFLKPADEAPMTRLQMGNVIPKRDEKDNDEEAPVYKLWHQNKTKKIMQGHQHGVFRGGLRRLAKAVETGA